MQEIIKGILEVVVGLAMLPIAGGFVAYVSADKNLSGIIGFSLIMSLVVVILGLGIVYHAVKTFFLK